MIEIQKQTYTEEEARGIQKYLKDWMQSSMAEIMQNGHHLIPSERMLQVLLVRMNEVDEQISYWSD